LQQTLLILHKIKIYLSDINTNDRNFAFNKIVDNVFQVAWRSGRSLKDWQTNHPRTQGERKAMQQLSIKTYTKCFEKRCHEKIEPMVEDAQFGFRPERSSTSQIFTPKKFL